MFVGLGFDLMEDLSYASRSALMSLDSDVAGAGQSLLVRVHRGAGALVLRSSVGMLLLLPSFAERGRWATPRRMSTAIVLLLAGPLLHFVWDAPLPDDEKWVGDRVRVAAR